MLICPICKNKLSKVKSSYICNKMHTFDISKEGYINLLSPKIKPGDNKEMINARINVHKEMLYDPLVEKITDIIKDKVKPDSVVLDSGCGDGYYLNYLRNKLNFLGYGLDISKYAISKASKLCNDSFFMVASSLDIPLSSNSVDLVLSIFSPYFDNSFARVLKDDCLLIIVSPSKNHLIEIKKCLYDNTYLNEEKNYILPSFCLEKSFDITYQKDVKNVIELIKMTPYYYKTNKEKLEDLKKLTSLKTTFDFKILLFKKVKSAN